MIDIYELLIVIVPIVIYGIVCKNKKRMTYWHLIGLLIFGVYLYGVFQVTGSGTFYDYKRYGLEIRPVQLNLKLFGNTSALHDKLNIFLFIPLGILVPFIWSCYNKLHDVLFLGFLLSLLIELSQLLNHRSTDVDDLLLNTIGAVLGFIFYKICTWFIKGLRTRKINMAKFEVYLLILGVFLSRFFLYRS